MSRIGYITCIQHTHEDLKRKTWCDKILSGAEFVFINIDHAVYNAMNQGRLMVCKNCLKAVKKIFKEHK